MRRITICTLALVSALSLPASAVITNSPTGTGRNTTPPAEGTAARTAWDLQGEFGRYLGTPISPTHFITAAHFGVQFHPFFFRGTTYNLDTTFGSGGFVNVPNTDLRIWKINGALPAHAQINSDTGAASPYENGKIATLFGRGTQRGDPIITNGAQRGWYHGPHDNGSASPMSWGDNRINGTALQGSFGETLFYNFTATGAMDATSNEASLSDADSGGGLFITDANTGIPELAAIHLGIEGPFSLSPTGANSFFGAVYDKLTLYAFNNQAQAWVLAGTGGSNAFSTRISPHAQFIYNTVQTASLNQQNFTATGNYSFGDVAVSNALTLSAGANLLANHIRGGAVSIGSNSILRTRPNGSPSGVSKVASLSINSTNVLDLADNALIIQNPSADQLTNLRTLVANARNANANFLWTGNGITSSTARNNPLYGLALILNSDNGTTPIRPTYKGQSAGPNDVLIAYALNGDSDLNGAIDVDDYARLDKGFIERRAGYRWGDFNYDGSINQADYALIDASFFSQNPNATESPSSFSVVPEPGIAFLSLLATATLLRRRRSPR